MTPDQAPGRAGVLVLVAHIVALLGGVAYAWGQWTDVAMQRALIEQNRHIVQQLDDRLAAAGGAPTFVSTPPMRDPFLQGVSAAVAEANLQDEVVSAIRAAGGTVTSSQVDTAGAAAVSGTSSGPPAVQLTVSCQIRNAALQGLLYGLETRAPALFLDQITMESEGRAGDPTATAGDALKISMVISAYWTGDGKS